MSEHQPEAGVNFLDIDLNLLIALDALLASQSVTVAAEALHRSQPALSASLKRLRYRFDDELLLRVGNRYELTPLAVQLRPRVATLLADVERLFATRSVFDAAESTREFVVFTADYGQQLLGRAIADELATSAPNARLRFLPLTDEVIFDARNALRSVDGLIMPAGFVDGLPHIDAFADRWVLIVARDNERVGDSVTLEELANLRWVTSFHRNGSQVPAIRQLQLLGVEPNVDIALEGFDSLPSFLRGTDRIAVIQERLAARIASPADYRLLECPFDVVPLVEAMWWHPSLERDPGHSWFRSIVETAGRRIDAEPVWRTSLSATSMQDIS